MVSAGRFQLICLSGKWLEVSAYPSPDGLSVYFRDKEERKRMQDSLREKEEQLRQITDNMMDVIMKVDTKGVVQNVSTSIRGEHERVGSCPS